MIRTTVVIRDEHLREMRDLVLPVNGNEGAAYLLFGRSQVTSDPWSGEAGEDFLSYTVIPIPEEDFLSVAVDHVTWSTTSFVRLLRQAAYEGLTVGIVHSHPGGPADFSDQDRRNEAQLAQLACNRNGVGTQVVSVLLTGDGQVRAQIWRDPNSPRPATRVRTIGRQLGVWELNPTKPIGKVHDRQALAFGEGANAQLRSLRVGVVGVGGTGSATAVLLSRLGVRKLALFDDDHVDETNLNRLHGARQSDAEDQTRKVIVLKREIEAMGLSTEVVCFESWVGGEKCRDALKSCDVIFGCTDDNDGRLLLNRLAYFYLVPVIDMGLAIEPEPAGGGVRELSGRCTVLAPGGTCLLCRGIIDIVLAREDDLRRRDPDAFERLKKEAYVRGGGNPAPAVITFTTANGVHGNRRVAPRTHELSWRWRVGLAARASLRPDEGSSAWICAK